MELKEAIAAASPMIRQLYGEVLQDQELLQYSSITANRLASRCVFSNSVSPFDETLILSLWAHGLIDAESTAKRSNWTDIPSCQASWSDVLKFQKPQNQARQPQFHVYRLYPLWRIYRTAKAPLHPIRFPRYGVSDDIDRPLHWSHIDGNNSFARDNDFLSRINLISALAIVCEPCTYTQITGRLSYSFGSNPLTVQSRRRAYWRKLEANLQSTGIESLETIRTELCRSSQQVDPNVRVQKLLRLCKHEFQFSLKGSLFVALLFNEMAETIRRATEAAFNVCLPEEDQIGYLTWNSAARTRIFGAGRPLDAPPRVWKAFLRDLDIDPEIKARVYVEGSTEQGAFERLLGEYPHVEIINLAGRVHQKGEPAFLQSLKNDIHRQIFSFIVIDTDRSENSEVIRKAAVRGDFFGEVYLFEGDFDLSAVSEENRIQAILEIAKSGGATHADLTEIEKSIDFTAGFGIHDDPYVNAVWRQQTMTDDPRVESNTRGRVVFAKSQPDTRSVQVFINLKDNSAQLDEEAFVPFGQVVEGMDVVDSWYADYGDGPPRGEGVYQQMAIARGAEYLGEFPELDVITDATVVEGTSGG